LPANNYHMEKTLSDLDKLELLINSQWTMYKQAIKDNKSFEEVKSIYLKIKDLQKQADVLMQKANELHSSMSSNESGFLSE